MPGRYAKPISLHLFEGNPNRLTKKQIEARKKSETHFGDHNFIPSSKLKKNKIAYKKWRELVNLYISGNIDFVTTSDNDLLERYCFTFSDLEFLRSVQNEIFKAGKKAGVSNTGIYLKIDETNLFKKITMLNDSLLKMGRELILTPISKAGKLHIPPKEKPVDLLEQAGFGNV